MRKLLPRTRKCLFCDQIADSREHVIPEWLSKRMGIRDLGFHPAHYSETGGLELRPLIKCEHLTTKQVCGNCNSGWTSGLEAWAQNRLGPYVEPAKEFDGFVGLQSMPDESQMIVRWLLKTAIIVERALPMADTAKVAPALYPVAKGTHPPTHFWAWAAYIVEPAFELHLLPGFPVWNGGVLQPFQVHAESMNFALQLNHLVLQLFRCPDATPTLKAGIHIGRHNCPAIPMWLTIRAPFPEPSLPVFPNFTSFRDALEVSATAPDEVAG